MIRVFTDGIVKNGIGAYAYAVVENKDGGQVQIGDSKGTMVFTSGFLRASYAQAGKTLDDDRMKMRAVYEGVRHCPDGVGVKVATDDFLMQAALKVTMPNQVNGDIAAKYRAYIEAHRISVSFALTDYYNGDDLPDNDHDEWTWYVRNLCEQAIKNYAK